LGAGNPEFSAGRNYVGLDGGPGDMGGGGMRKYGWKGVIPDFRDTAYAYKTIGPRLEEDIPPVKYLICPPVVDQEDLGSCVFFALTAHMAATAVQNDRDPLNLSQLWAYYHYRKTHGLVEYDDGAYIREAIKLVAAAGIPHEDCWPYVTGNFAKGPPDECLIEAKANRIKSYHALETRDDMILCLAAGFGFVCGISVYTSFDSESTAKTGIVTMPGPGDKFLGGHALYFWGYNLHKDVFHFQNSYSRGWGEDGHGTIPISYLSNRGLAGDIFTIRS
jgi:C1A family cysteine protease